MRLRWFTKLAIFLCLWGLTLALATAVSRSEETISRPRYPYADIYEDRQAVTWGMPPWLGREQDPPSYKIYDSNAYDLRWGLRASPVLITTAALSILPLVLLLTAVVIAVAERKQIRPPDEASETMTSIRLRGVVKVFSAAVFIAVAVAVWQGWPHYCWWSREDMCPVVLATACVVAAVGVAALWTQQRVWNIAALSMAGMLLSQGPLMISVFYYRRSFAYNESPTGLIVICLASSLGLAGYGLYRGVRRWKRAKSARAREAAASALQPWESVSPVEPLTHAADEPGEPATLRWEVMLAWRLTAAVPLLASIWVAQVKCYPSWAYFSYYWHWLWDTRDWIPLPGLYSLIQMIWLVGLFLPWRNWRRLAAAASVLTALFFALSWSALAVTVWHEMFYGRPGVSISGEVSKYNFRLLCSVAILPFAWHLFMLESAGAKVLPRAVKLPPPPEQEMEASGDWDGAKSG